MWTCAEHKHLKWKGDAGGWIQVLLWDQLIWVIRSHITGSNWRSSGQKNIGLTCNPQLSSSLHVNVHEQRDSRVNKCSGKDIGCTDTSTGALHRECVQAPQGIHSWVCVKGTQWKIHTCWFQRSQARLPKLMFYWEHLISNWNGLGTVLIALMITHVKSHPSTPMWMIYRWNSKSLLNCG